MSTYIAAYPSSSITLVLSSSTPGLCYNSLGCHFISGASLLHACVFLSELCDGRTFSQCGYTFHQSFKMGRINLTFSVAPLYSPASLHPDCHSECRCPLPGQIRSWKNRCLCPDDSPPAGASSWRMLDTCYVPHQRAGISDQERICPI